MGIMGIFVFDEYFYIYQMKYKRKLSMLMVLVTSDSITHLLAFGWDTLPDQLKFHSLAFDFRLKKLFLIIIITKSKK